MAKEKEVKQKAAATTTAVATQAKTVAVTPPAEQTTAQQLEALGASPALIKRAIKAADNFAMMENPKIPRLKKVADGVLMGEADDEEPVEEVRGVIIFAAKYKSYYKEAYDEDNVVPPDCFSHDGKVPYPDVESPVSPVCKGCPMNEFETDVRKKGKACRDMRRLFLVTGDSIMPRQLNVTPSAIKNWDDYLSKLVTFGYSYNEVETVITAKKKKSSDPHVTFSFARGKVYDETKPEDAQALKNFSALRTLWHSHMERSHAEPEREEAPPAASEPSKGGGKGEY
jgi:hypothetical protein